MIALILMTMFFMQNGWNLGYLVVGYLAAMIAGVMCAVINNKTKNTD